MKIKIIDLLNKIANDEEVPKKIKWGDYELEWEELGYHDYKFLDIGSYFLFQGFATSVLNDYVEIIEEPKKIEKISWREKESLSGNFTASEKQEVLARRTEKLKSSLNELIDEINKLKEK